MDFANRIVESLDKDITQTTDKIIRRLDLADNAKSRNQIEQARIDLINLYGIKIAIFKYVQRLNHKHQTNNMLPIPILRKSLAKTLPAEFQQDKEQQDSILRELVTDNMIELVPLPKDHQYTVDVFNEGLTDDQNVIKYFIRQKVWTPEILESIAKHNPRVLETRPELVSSTSAMQETSSELDPFKHQKILKKLTDKFDLSNPKERASKVAFELNKDLNNQFKMVCQQNNITIREGLHAALAIFCHNFKKHD